MSKNGRDRRPYVKPVTKIELSTKNIKLRWILIIVCLVIAAVSISIGVSSLLNTEPGWQEVEVSSDKRNCSTDFILMYEFTGSATAQYRQITSLYSTATEDAYAIFTADEEVEGYQNVYSVNANVNEVVTVDETLYNAFALLEAYGVRYQYMAPVYVEYNRVFLADNESDALRYDPARNPETMAYIQEVTAYTNDPEMIRIELLGSNQVRLNVSEEYLAFAEENSIEKYVDFAWMTNAFIIDYIADLLAENGYTDGYLSSYDGFTRNLDARGNSYSFNIFDGKGSDIYMPARMQYAQPTGIVYLRSYAMVDQDKWHYYSFENGNVVTTYLDPADGVSKSAAENLVCYSSDVGCAEILMQAAPVFIADDLKQETLSGLTGQGIYSIWFTDWYLNYNDPNLVLEANGDGGAERYTYSLVK